MTTTVGIMAANSVAGASPDCAVVAGVESAVREGGCLTPVPALDTRWLSFSTKRIVPKIEGKMMWRCNTPPFELKILCSQLCIFSKDSQNYQEFHQNLQPI